MAAKIRITFMSGAEDGREVVVDSPTLSIGREERNDVVVPFDSRVSRRHVRVEANGGKLEVTDLNSRNGTYLQDGSRITGPVVVSPGALFRLGRTWLKVEWTNNNDV